MYLIKFTVALLVFLLFYRFFLEKEKAFVTNRFFLLIALVFSFFIPFIVIPDHWFLIDLPRSWEALPALSDPILSGSIVENQSSDLPYLRDKSVFNRYSFLLAAYWIISLILFLRFGYNLILMMRRIRNGLKVNKGTHILVISEKPCPPHSFFKYIFIYKQDYKNGIDPEIMRHEMRHISAYHSLDIMLTELLLCLLWWNPVFLWFRYLLQLNHEFYADDREGVFNKQHYKRLLYHELRTTKINYLASGFHYSFIKKRFKMIDKSRSGPLFWFRHLSAIPILLLMILLLGNTTNAQSTEKNVAVEIDGQHMTGKVKFYHSSQGKTMLNGDEIARIIKSKGVTVFDEITFEVNNKNFNGSEVGTFIYSEEPSEIFMRNLNPYKAILIIKTNQGPENKKVRGIKSNSDEEGNVRNDMIQYPASEKQIPPPPPPPPPPPSPPSPAGQMQNGAPGLAPPPPPPPPPPLPPAPKKEKEKNN